MLYRAFVILFVLLSCNSTEVRSDEPKHSLFIAGPNFTGILGEDGQIAWDTGKPSARDGWILPNGNALIAWQGEVLEMKPNKETVFRYARSMENKEIGTVERLENGNTLVTELGPKPKLLELSPDGRIVVEVPLQPETENAHMQTRMARKLPNGNYLVPHLLAFKVKEYAADGKVVSELKTDREELGGRAAENWPFTAIRLQDGNTLTSLTHGNKVVEWDAQGNIVWQISNQDFDNKPFVDPCGIQRLSNGNTMIASYGATKGIKLFEVNRSKQIVWQYSGPYRAHELQVLTTNGKNESGRPLK